MLAWKAVTVEMALLSLQRFHNHIQELAQFGALFTKQPSKSTSNITPCQTENSFLPLCRLENDLTSVIMPSLSFGRSLMKAVSATPPSEIPLKQVYTFYHE